MEARLSLLSVVYWLGLQFGTHVSEYFVVIFVLNLHTHRLFFHEGVRSFA